MTVLFLTATIQLIMFNISSAKIFSGVLFTFSLVFELDIFSKKIKCIHEKHYPRLFTKGCHDICYKKICIVNIRFRSIFLSRSVVIVTQK